MTALTLQGQKPDPGSFVLITSPLPLLTWSAKYIWEARTGNVGEKKGWGFVGASDDFRGGKKVGNGSEFRGRQV